MLTQAYLKELLRYEPCTGHFFWWGGNLRSAVSGLRAGWLDKNGYVCITIKYRKYFAHRLAWLYCYGTWPLEIDHLDGQPTNNRVLNLLSVTHQEHMRRHRSLLPGDQRYGR